ncbi:MAG: efflux RND transporter periplasmic adaptor subunit [Candidatus Margulisbacteria bacterium]|nr:efflux RND transporter periplasmic adaptor subunit [Candidatus Margulisiibacteriota bacterium]
MKNNHFKTAVMFLVLIAVLAGGLWYLLRPKNDELLASGTIEATEVALSSEVSGNVIKLNINEGSTVKAGEIVALIDPAPYQADLKRAQAQYDLAKSDYGRAAELYKDKSISAQQHDSARSAMEAARATLDLAAIQLKNTSITSPIDGTVLVKAIEQGELAMPGSPIVTVANLDEMKITIYIPENQIGKVRLGQKAEVYVDSYPGEKFLGEVSYIADKAEFTPKNIQTKEERVTQVFGIKIVLLNPEGKLKPGMPADALILWNHE